MLGCMNKTRDFHLTEEKRRELEYARVHDEHLEVRVRCEALLKLADGERLVDVARHCDVTLKTLYNWHDRYLAAGIAGLVDRPRSGRPRKATPEYVAKLEQVLSTPPQTYGYDFTLWTLQRLSAHLERETAIALSLRALYTLLECEEYRYLRPKYGLRHLQDREAVERAQANYAQLKGGPSDRTTPTALISSSLWTKPP